MQQLAGLVRRRATADRSPRPGGERGIEEVDVEREIRGTVTDHLADAGGRGVDGRGEQRIGLDDREPERLGVGGAHPELDRARRVDDALACGEVTPGAVVEVVAHAPGVGVGVEVDQGQRPVRGGMGLEQRVRHHVVAAERQHRHAGIEDRAHREPYRVDHPIRVAGH